MSAERTVFVVGSTGRTGRRVVTQLLDRGVRVRTVVRSAQRLPGEVARNRRLTVVEADLLSMADSALRPLIDGCDAVVSCLGHTISLKGVFGPPRDLVTRATARVCRLVESMKPAGPVRFVLMSSVSVSRPGRVDTRRGAFERACVAALSVLVPPTRDNQEAANFLASDIGAASSSIQWTVVRPDSLLEGDVSGYTVHEGLVNSLFAPARTNMANVAHFMCELVTDTEVWDEWRGKMPVIVNAAEPAR